LEFKYNTERGQQDGMICHSRAFQDIKVPLEDAIMKFPLPLTTGGTKRTSAHMVYPLSLA